MVDLAEMGEILRRRRMARTYILGYCVCCESKELQDICVDTMMCRECLGITVCPLPHLCGATEVQNLCDECKDETEI